LIDYQVDKVPHAWIEAASAVVCWSVTGNAISAIIA
jgi:hypothetical protein